MFLYVGIAVGVGEKLKHEKLGKLTYMICLDNLADCHIFGKNKI